MTRTTNKLASYEKNKQAADNFIALDSHTKRGDRIHLQHKTHCNPCPISKYLRVTADERKV